MKGTARVKAMAPDREAIGRVLPILGRLGNDKVGRTQGRLYPLLRPIGKRAQRPLRRAPS